MAVIKKDIIFNYPTNLIDVMNYDGTTIDLYFQVAPATDDGKEPDPSDWATHIVSGEWIAIGTIQPTYVDGRYITYGLTNHDDWMWSGWIRFKLQNGNNELISKPIQLSQSYGAISLFLKLTPLTGKVGVFGLLQGI